MRVAVVGQGYVGLTASVCLARQGHEVIGIEADPQRLAPLVAGAAPIFEPGLQEQLSLQRALGRLCFQQSYEDCIRTPDAVVIAVGTPPLPSGGADLRFVHDALDEVVSRDGLPALVVVKSSIPPGSSEALLDRVAARRDLRSRYVYSPEFLSQGAALEGWRQPTRIVAGLHEPALVPHLRELYRGIEAPWLLTSPTSAEMVKYASNAMLATRVSFVNEIANLCDAVGANVDDVARGVGLDPRLGPHFLRAGVGFGGSCFPKDTSALLRTAHDARVSMQVLQAALETNRRQQLRAVEVARSHLRPRGGDRVAVLGLSFKPGTDDLRSAPSLAVIPELIALGHHVRAWDPTARGLARDVLPPAADLAPSLADALEGAAVALVLTEWPEIVDADWPALAATMAAPRALVDGRNCIAPHVAARAGLIYRGIGRGRTDPQPRPSQPRADAAGTPSPFRADEPPPLVAPALAGARSGPGGG